MDKSELGILIVTLFFVMLNWGLSLIFSRKNNLDWQADLRQLWPESKFFFKAQTIMLALCIGGMTYQITANPEELVQPATHLGLLALVAKLSQGILPILQLFYITHLGSKTNPLLVSTIGIWTVIQFGVGEYIRDLLSLLGLIVVIAPGFIIWFRSTLFMPIYALEGRQVGHAWHHSWELTEGKFWLVSRYLSPVLMASMVSTILPNLVHNIFTKVASRSQGITDSPLWQILVPIGIVGSAVSAVAIIALELIFTGLLYKLYIHLSGRTENAE